MSHPVLTVHGMDTPLTSVAPQDQQHRLQDAIDHLAGPLAARPEAALAEIGLHDVRSYRITVNGDTKYNVVAVDSSGEFHTATAWSPAGAVALLIAEVATAPLAAAAA